MREGSLLLSALRSASNSSFPSNAELSFPGGAIAVTKAKPTVMVGEKDYQWSSSIRPQERKLSSLEAQDYSSRMQEPPPSR